jgi:hypothetical protein
MIFTTSCEQSLEHKDADMTIDPGYELHSSDRRKVTTFRTRLALVWTFLSELLPKNTNVSRSKQIPRSLISALHEEKEQNQCQ